MFTIILVESSLELIPAELSNHQSVLAYSKKFKKNISNTLLDNSWHFGAMKGLENEICLLYTSPSPRDATLSRMPSSA